MPLPPGAALILAAASLLTAVTGIPLTGQAGLSEAVSCHVCGPPSASASAKLFPGQPPPPDCQTEAGSDLPASSRVCPPNYRGCLTTYNGAEVMRTCAERAYDPCKVANDVVYCYCSGRLCNSQSVDQLKDMMETLGRLRTTTEDASAGEDHDDGDGLEDGQGSGRGALTDDTEDDNEGRVTPVDLPPSTSSNSRGTTSTTSGDFYLSSTSEEVGTAGAGTGSATSTESTEKSEKGSGSRVRSGLLWGLVAVCVLLRAELEAF